MVYGRFWLAEDGVYGANDIMNAWTPVDIVGGVLHPVSGLFHSYLDDKGLSAD